MVLSAGKEMASVPLGGSLRRERAWVRRARKLLRRREGRVNRGREVPDLLLLPQQCLGLLEPSLDFLKSLISILGSTVQLLLQEAQPHIGLTELFPLDEDGACPVALHFP